MMAETFDMEENEFKEFYIDWKKKMETESEWEMNLTKRISNGEISCDDETFNKEYNKYKTSTDIKKKYESLQKLKNIYKDNLVKQATIEYIN